MISAFFLLFRCLSHIYFLAIESISQDTLIFNDVTSPKQNVFFLFFFCVTYDFVMKKRSCPVLLEAKMKLAGNHTLFKDNKKITSILVKRREVFCYIFICWFFFNFYTSFYHS